MSEPNILTVVEKLEDHARVCDTIDAICCALENGTSMPNFIPMCNDGMLTDQLGKIAEHITLLRDKLL